jgi:ribulose-5-phosphate 4-epimerase/fuculose-1-phosphate aldolase
MSQLASHSNLSSKPSTGSVKQQVSAEEWQARTTLAACYRLVAHFGWDDLIATHISMRVPGLEDHFLLNPFGMMFHEITASSLIKVDLDGNTIGESDYKINKAGYIIHSAVHRGRSDVKTVFHTHTTAGMAVSAQQQGLLPISQTALVAMNSISYHTYEGGALYPEERERLVADLGNEWTMILRNHGLLSCGINAADAFYRLHTLERACSIQTAALAGGTQLEYPSQDVQELTKKQGAKIFGPAADLIWPALMRMIEAKDASFKD